MGGFKFLKTYQRLLLARQHAIVIDMLTTSMHPTNGQRANQLPVVGFLLEPLPVRKMAQVLADYFYRGSPNYST